jgi:hypothetical protein
MQMLLFSLLLCLGTEAQQNVTYRFTPTKLRGGTIVQIAEIQFRTPGSNDSVVISNAQATNAGGSNPANEGPEKAIDGDLYSKWLDRNGGPLVVSWATRISIDAFRFVTANDVINRDPMQWKLEVFSGNSWIILHQQITDYATTSQRHTPTPWFELLMQASTTTTTQASIRYMGCYLNRGADRVEGHSGDKTVYECQATAETSDKGYFGMEYPQGYSSPGHAQCLPLSTLPSMTLEPESACEEEVFNGQRLGDAYRLAVYSIQAIYTERPLVAVEGNNVGSISPLTSVYACKQACTSNPRCNSFAVCQSGPSGCWMKGKVVNMSDATSTNSNALNTRKCKTWFRGQACGGSSSLNEFSSQDQMEQAGWGFSWNDANTFKPAGLQRRVPSASYWGFMEPGDAVISLTLKGSGTLTLDYGNSWSAGFSRVFLNDVLQDEVGNSTLSKSVTFGFNSNDVLKLREDNIGILVINDITFSCQANACPTGYDATPYNLDGAGKQWSENPANTVTGCASICNQRYGCTSFEFNKGGDENYKCGTYTGGSSNVQRGLQTSTWQSCTKAVGYTLVNSGVECKSGDISMGSKASVEQCADAVKSNGGKYFVFGTGGKAGKCYQENTASATCPEGWETDSYDFYALALQATTTTAASTATTTAAMTATATAATTATEKPTTTTPPIATSTGAIMTSAIEKTTTSTPTTPIAAATTTISIFVDADQNDDSSSVSLILGGSVAGVILLACGLYGGYKFCKTERMVM